MKFSIGEVVAYKHYDNNYKKYAMTFVPKYLKIIKIDNDFIYYEHLYEKRVLRPMYIRKAKPFEILLYNIKETKFIKLLKNLNIWIK